jgi:hypothetical protein
MACGKEADCDNDCLNCARNEFIDNEFLLDQNYDDYETGINGVPKE